MNETYKLRTCYVNFAEHLQNSWNVNFMYNDAPGMWSDKEWSAFFKEIKAFGFTNFQFWIPPTLVKPGEDRANAIKPLNEVIRLCHGEGITVNPLITVNTIGAEWYFACPNDKEDRKRIFEFWEFYAENLKGVDIFTIFPGDPGGCNRNGCNHNTYLELSAELVKMLKEKIPGITVEVGTWGTPFTGWGEDMRHTPNWDGTFAMLVDPGVNNPEIPCHIWNGSPERVKVCMNDMMDRLKLFPEDTVFSLNVGFNPDSEPDDGYDGRPWIKEIAKKFRVNSWDYSASEGELICYPHFRVGKYKRKRLTELETAPYYGSICYTMSPKLNLLMLYTSAQLMMNPERSPKEVAGEFTEKVFGDRKIGELMEAFEIVPGWGYEDTPFTKEELKEMFGELIVRLKAVKGFKSQLPVFPDEEEYRETLLWHAENFLYMFGENPDREKVREDYKNKALAIYDTIPKAVDERSVLSAKGYSQIGTELKK